MPDSPPAQRRELELAARPLGEPTPPGLLERAITVASGKRTRGQFAHHFLPKIGAEKTERTMLVMLSWMQAEGDAGRFNPLNTTWHLPGSTRFNSADVQNYLSFDDGVKATALTLNTGARHNEHGYLAIRHALVKNQKPEVALQAVEESAWGTGGLALRVYEETPDAVILGLRSHRLAH